MSACLLLNNLARNNDKIIYCIHVWSIYSLNFLASFFLGTLRLLNALVHALVRWPHFGFLSFFQLLPFFPHSPSLLSAPLSACRHHQMFFNPDLTIMFPKNRMCMLKHEGCSVTNNSSFFVREWPLIKCSVKDVGYLRSVSLLKRNKIRHCSFNKEFSIGKVLSAGALHNWQDTALNYRV